MPDKSNILDIGSGQGPNSFNIIKSQKHTVFINDISDKALLQQLRAYDYSERFGVFLNTDSFPNHTNFKENFFDCIILANVIHYLNPDSLHESLRKLKLWLKPGGKIFICALTPFAKPFLRQLKEIDKNRFSDRIEKRTTYTGDESFPYPQLLGELKSFVKWHDFKIIRNYYFPISYPTPNDKRRDFVKDLICNFKPDTESLFIGEHIKKSPNMNSWLYFEVLLNNKDKKDWFKYLEYIIHYFNSIGLIMEK